LVGAPGWTADGNASGGAFVYRRLCDDGRFLLTERIEGPRDGSRAGIETTLDGERIFLGAEFASTSGRVYIARRSAPLP